LSDREATVKTLHRGFISLLLSVGRLSMVKLFPSPSYDFLGSESTGTSHIITTRVFNAMYILSKPIFRTQTPSTFHIRFKELSGRWFPRSKSWRYWSRLSCVKVTRPSLLSSTLSLGSSPCVNFDAQIFVSSIKNTVGELMSMPVLFANMVK
jgi:hypothetical protein